MKASRRRKIKHLLWSFGEKCPKCRARSALELRGEVVLCTHCGAEFPEFLDVS